MTLILDACLLHDLQKVKDISNQCRSLYADQNNSLIDVAPYLVDTFSDELYTWFFAEGWGHNYGIYLQSSSTFEDTRRHLKKFLFIKTEEGSELYFRFYDPRVLRIFLPTCDSKQLNEFFGPVEYFICEDEDPAFGLKFSFENNALITERLTKEQILTWHIAINYFQVLNREVCPTIIKQRIQK